MSLQGISANSQKLIDTFCLLDADMIPMELVRGANDLTVGSQVLAVHDSLENLLGHSLINVVDDGTGITIHKYFQSLMLRRLRASHDRLLAGLGAVLDCLCRMLPSVAYIGRHPETWSTLERYLPHVRSVRDKLGGKIPEEVAAHGVDLLCRYGSYFYETAQYHFGFQYIEAAIELAQDRTDVDPRVLCYSYYIHAYLSLESNRPEDSERSLRRAQTILQDSILSGPAPMPVNDRLFEIAIKSLLGNTCTAMARYESESLQRSAIDLALLGGVPTSGKLGTLYANLGSCLLWKGDLEAAEDVLHKSLLQYQRNLDCNLYTLGNVYLGQKRYEEAYKMHLEVLENFSTSLGPLHHTTADSCHKIGSILAMQEFPGNDLSEAEKYLRQALIIYGESLKKACVGMEPSIARSKWKLATVLQARTDVIANVEIEKLRTEATEYSILRRSLDVPADPGAAEALFDSFVLFWSR